MRSKKTLRSILALSIILAFLVAGAPGSGIAIASDGPVPDLPTIAKHGKGHPNMSSALSDLAAIRQADGPEAAADFARSRLMDFAEGRVKVVVEAMPGKAASAGKAAEALGARIDAGYDNLVRVLVPVPALTALAGNPAVRYVREPRRAVPHALTSEGVSLIQADDWQSAGFTGSGVKVGVLDVGFAGYTTRQSQGELPATITTQWYIPAGSEGTSEHGTACAEIIYDIAPDANFYLTNVEDDVDFPNAVDWLISQGVDVISCSLGWPLWGPGDGTGLACSKIADAKAAGIIWANSAGNDAEGHWSGTWADSGAGVGQLGEDWHEFAGVDETNHIYAEYGDPILVALRWDDTWGASNNDYDLYLLNSTLTTIVAYSEVIQDGTVDPAEYIGIYAPYAGEQQYHIAIHRWSAAGTPTFHLFTKYNDLEHQVAAGSLDVPADSPDAMTVGAVYWGDPSTIEPFSSQGPTTDSRTKPDVVAPDGVATRSYSPYAFFGTSASAPHGAGAAALVKDAYPSYTPDQVQSYLESRAVDLGAGGKDNVFGSGRLDLGTPPAPPTVTTDAATGVVGTIATLNGTLDALGSASSVDVSFEWGNTTAYGNETAPQPMTGTGAFSESLSGLMPDTTYHYRAKAVGDLTAYGEDQTFETCIPGDANDDGVVDGRDVIRCKKIILGLEDATCGADANEDGTVDGRDVVRTKKAVLGIE